MTLYGISNCDSVRKARSWLKARNVEYQFHDFRKDGLNKAKINSWLKLVNWQDLLNTRSATYRKVPQEIKDNLNKTMALNLMHGEPTLIKRPLLELDNKLLIGFKPDIYQDTI